jgi:DNA-binding CsgD family transcriptional regulator
MIILGAEELRQANRTLAGLRASVPSATRWGCPLASSRCFALVAKGVSNQQIGDRLYVNAFIVKRHIANSLTKLNLSTPRRRRLRDPRGVIK